MASAGADEPSNGLTSGGSTSTYRRDDDGEGNPLSSQHRRPRGPGDLLLLGRVQFVAAGSAGMPSQHHHQDQGHPRQHYNQAPTSKTLVSNNAKVVNMMRLMNYEVGSGSGLGKHCQGITSPIKLAERPRPGTAGFGTVGAEGEGSYDNGLPKTDPCTVPNKWAHAIGPSQLVYDSREMCDADGSRKLGREFCDQIMAAQAAAPEMQDGEHIEDAVEAITKAVTLVHEKSVSGELTAGDLILEFTRLKEKFPEEYKPYCLATTAGVLVAPLVGPVLQKWQPLWDPTLWLDVFGLLKNILDDDEDESAMSPYAELIDETVVPAVQASEWKATDPERMLRFLAAWKDMLPPSAVQSILAEVVVPALTAEVESWNARCPWQATCCHPLVLPWIPLAGPLLESLAVTVRRKLEKALQELNDAGRALISESNRKLVAPWKGLFAPESWEEFVDGIGVVPHLSQHLQRLRITPPKQKDDAFWTVIMKWAPLVRAEDMVRLLETKFFGGWLNALRRWLLAAKPATREAVEWCKGWELAITPELRADGRVLGRIEAGLAMVDRAAQGLEI